jgi:hypothetical protein
LLKVATQAIHDRFPEGPSKQFYSDVQFVNSAWWGLTSEQTQAERRNAITSRETYEVYEMVERLVDMFSTEETIQVPGNDDDIVEYVVPPKVDSKCVEERNVGDEAEDSFQSRLWDECVQLPGFIPVGYSDWHSRARCTQEFVDMD